MKMKHSMKMQFALMFICLTTGTILLCLLLNSTLLEEYYIEKKQKALMDAYYSINNASIKGDITSEDYDIEIQKICEKYNISILVADSNSKTIKASMQDPEQVINRLLDNIFMGELKGSILAETENYTLQIQKDYRTDTEYMELWGILDNGYLFLIRTAIEAIEDSVAIANRFLLYVGLLAIVISVCIVIILSDRITKPILELAKISERMKSLDFDAKYTGKEKTEIGILGNNINELSETLQTTISELKTANNELVKDIERKNEIDEMRKEFLSNVSHELKTPIAIIQGYAEGLKEGISDDPESRDFYCDVIVDEASKMNNMVKKLLSLNQLEFGKEVVNIERFEISSLVKGCIAASDLIIKQKEIDIRMNDYNDIYVWGDEYMIEEVFINFFTNALNHCENEKIIDIKIVTADTKVRVSVFNTGRPIPDESIDKIWDKFYKVDKARTREYGGNGIGLSIVKAIMEAHNQQYGVENYSNGVEFWFCLDKV